MKAAFYERTGAAADVLQLGELDDPTPAAGEVRVHLRWSGVNPSDVKSRAGLRSSVMPFARVIPHSDGMGGIDAVGEGVNAHWMGERVWVWNGAWKRPNGTAATFIVVPQQQAVRLPDGTPDEAGACLGIPALTAMHGLLAAGGVGGKRVLVAGGAGAVGHYAVQFARLLGATQVLGTVSTEEKADIARAAGADVAIEYRRDDAAAQILQATEGEGVDRIIEVDIAANGVLDQTVLRDGGEAMVYGSGAAAFTMPFFPMISKNIALHFYIVYNLDPAARALAIRTLTGFLERGVVQHQIAARYPIESIVEAHQCVEQGQAVGNVVVEIDAAARS